MFLHNFKYSFKTLFRTKALIFWTFAFPIILATFFNMAFSNITKSEKLDIIDIAIIENEELYNNKVIKNAFDELSDEDNKDRIFNTNYTNEEDAKKLLEDDKVVGYLYLENNEPKLVFNTNGINQTIFKYVTEEIVETNDIINNIAEKEIRKGNNIDYEKIYSTVQNKENNIKDISLKNLDYTMIEFYTLIAMTCLYGGMLSMTVINQMLANMSNKGKRVTVAPTKKSVVILSSLLASYIVQLVGLLLLFIYTIFVLKVNYGNNIPLVILLSCVGSFTGLCMGLCIGSVLKKSEGVKVGIFLAITMLWCFLSGMMGVTLKYVIDKNIPIINMINPASIITDGFYSLYYYTSLNRYWFDIVSLLIFAFLLLIISFIGLRRQKYDSI